MSISETCNRRPPLRYERKGVIGAEQYAYLSRLCKSMMQADNHADAGGTYTVKSLYFDTPLLDDFYDNDQGAFSRRKMRLRVYGTGEDAVYRMEEKFREGDLSGKNTAVLTRTEAEQLCSGEFGSLLSRGEVGVRLYSLMTSQFYRPALAVRYDREAYLRPADGVRVTFDSNVRFASPAGFMDESAFVSGERITEIVFEVKYSAEFPAWLSRGFKSSGGNIEAKSKYADGIRRYFDLPL